MKGGTTEPNRTSSPGDIEPFGGFEGSLTDIWFLPWDGPKSLLSFFPSESEGLTIPPKDSYTHTLTILSVRLSLTVVVGRDWG